MNHTFRNGLIISALLSLLAGCSTTPPPQETHDNMCKIIGHDDVWAKAANNSFKRWGTPPHILLAIVHQESRFKPHAQPPRPYALGMVPLPRTSTAYGYAQAKDEAWYDYQKSTGKWTASRSNIDDALDFIGWYNHQSFTRLKIPRNDTFKLYLAYHEGHGGYSRMTYLKKEWLVNVAKKVSNKAREYQQQSKNCS